METKTTHRNTNNSLEATMQFTTKYRHHFPCKNPNESFEAILIDENGNECGLVRNPSGTVKIFRSKATAVNFDTEKLDRLNRLNAEHVSSQS